VHQSLFVVATVLWVGDRLGFQLLRLSAVWHLFPQAMDMVMDSDIVFWAGRYDLFVVWSTDRRHPWDSLTSSETVAAVLEIGIQGNSSSKVSQHKFMTAQQFVLCHHRKG
jgi:hypothetical protein